MTSLLRFALALLLAALAIAAPAQDLPLPEVPEVTLSSLRNQLEQIPSAIDGDDDMKRANALAADITAQTDKFVAARTGPLADLNARLGELGPGPAPGGTSTEAPDVTRQRALLLKQRNTLDADIRLARLLAVDAQQRRNDLLAQRRARAEAQLLERTDSPLGGSFWRRAAEDWKNDQARLHVLADKLRADLSTAFAPPMRAGTLAGLAAALTLLVLGNWLAAKALAWIAARSFPVGRLRRSLLALLTVLANILLTGLAAALAWATLEKAGDWSAQSDQLATATLRFSMFLAFVIGLGHALLSNHRPAWRLPSIPDAVAARLAPAPWLAALGALAAWIPMTVSQLTASTPNNVLTNLAPTLAFVAMLVFMLFRLRGVAPAQDAAAPSERPMWIGLLVGSMLAGALVVTLLLTIGYLALARTIAVQLNWTTIVIAMAYLLLKFADDLCMVLFSSRSAPGQRAQKLLGIAPQTLDQCAVLLSGISRVGVFFYMLIALVAPLGSSPDELWQRSTKLGIAFKIGEFTLVPREILSALLVLVAGFVLLRLFKRWLENTYLPNTTLETGMRSSLITLLGYVGGILVIAVTLSALGIGLNRITWVASALSVGIGFGLQAIVQNFISGLILLAERPVKVGDWVVLGTTEGDVRRINVRATEIQLGDRSTLIVPNSEFITKTVRNMTLANAEGRALIRLPMPLTTDAQKVRDVMLAACHAHEHVLEAPEPGVTLEGIENGLLIFQAISYVPNPRMAGSVRSDLLFSILQRLQADGVPMAAYAPAPTAVAAPAPPSPMPPGIV